MAGIECEIEDLKIGDQKVHDENVKGKSKEMEDAEAAQRRKKMNPDHIAVFDSIQKGNYKALETLISEKKISANIRDEHGMSPLLQAAYKGNYEMCEFLLSHGSDVNATSHKNFYTPLMMAALSGQQEIVKLLLDAGAKISTENSIGKTASDLAGFVGQREVAALIKNYLTFEQFQPYFTSQGGKAPRIEESLARDVYAIMRSSNYHPVKIVLTVHNNSALCNKQNLKKSKSVLEDLARKCVQSSKDCEEVLALKLLYVSSIFETCSEHLSKPDVTTLDSLLKTLIKENKRNVKPACEKLIRQSLMKFPYTDLPLLQYLVKTIAPANIEKEAKALNCLQSVFSGVQAVRDPDTWCAACGQRTADLRCGACKQIRYCCSQCQKLHWFVHKKKCNSK